MHRGSAASSCRRRPRGGAWNFPLRAFPSESLLDRVEVSAENFATIAETRDVFAYAAAQDTGRTPRGPSSVIELADGALILSVPSDLGQRGECSGVACDGPRVCYVGPDDDGTGAVVRRPGVSAVHVRAAGLGNPPPAGSSGRSGLSGASMPTTAMRAG